MLLTSEGWRGRGAVDALLQNDNPPREIVDSIGPNPKLSDLLALSRVLPRVDVLVALGGGSVIDSAKALAALQGLDRDEEAFTNHLRTGADLGPSIAPPTIVAVPTTSGSGSEVTRWGTVWGDDGIKFSVNHPALWPSHAILDPTLACTMPRSLTVATALDAISHAMEAIWNRRHAPLSDQLAQSAITILFSCLPRLLEDLNDRSLRQQVQTASVLAGLAMGTTQTALAHSMSYPFTSRFGMPHGIACSFTLAEVARFNLAEDAERLTPIAMGLNCSVSEIPSTLETWMDSLGLAQEVSKYVDQSVLALLDDNLITRARAANNIRMADGLEAKELIRAALSRFC